MVGRIDTYVHSDKSTENKGAAIVKVSCDTDFAAKTDVFKAFTADLAKLAYGAGTEDFIKVCEIFPTVKNRFVSLKEALHESIEVVEIKIMKL